jgi:hypothetical protein
MFQVLYYMNGFLNFHNSLSNSTNGMYLSLDIDDLLNQECYLVHNCILLFMHAEYRFTLIYDYYKLQHKNC